MTELCLCEAAIRLLFLYSLSIDWRIILLRFLGGKMSVSRGGIARSNARSGDDTGLSGLLLGGVSSGSRSTLIPALYSCLWRSSSTASNAASTLRRASLPGRFSRETEQSVTSRSTLLPVAKPKLLYAGSG